METKKVYTYYTKEGIEKVKEEVKKRTRYNGEDVFVKNCLESFEREKTILLGITNWVTMYNLEKKRINILGLLPDVEDRQQVIGHIEYVLYEGWCPSYTFSSYNNIIVCSFKDEIPKKIYELQECNSMWSLDYKMKNVEMIIDVV